MNPKVKEYNHERVRRATHKVVDKNGHTVFVGSLMDCVSKSSVRNRWEKQPFKVKEINDNAS
jgi:hypothetical protein